MVKRKSNIAIMAIIAVIMLVICAMFCLPMNVMAEEATSVSNISTRGANKESIFIPIGGNFKDGNRQYGSYLSNLTVTHISGQKYQVDVNITLLTQDYVTDRYRYDEFGYYYMGSGVKMVDLGNREFKVKVAGTEMSTSAEYVNPNQKGLWGCLLDFEKAKLNKHNNYPVITDKFFIEVIGNAPKIGIAFYSMDLVGISLAKDTLVRNIDFLKFETDIKDNFEDAYVTYYYMPNFKNRTFIVDAHYRTDGGPIPSKWSKPWGTL